MVAISFSRGSSQPRDQIYICFGKQILLPLSHLGSPHLHIYVYTNVTAEWFIIAKQVKQPKCLTTCEWINYTSYTLTIEYYLAREKTLIYATRWMNLESRLNKRTQSQKVIIVRFFSIWNDQKRQIHRNRKEISGCQGLGGGENGEC